jgi:hypothetical protein
MAVNPLQKTLGDFVKPCEKLTDYIKVYDDICDEQLCNEIVGAFESQEDNHVYINRSKRPTFTEMNISQQYSKKDSTWMVIQKQVQTCFIDAVSRYMNELDLGPDFPSKYAFEEFRVKKYRQDSDDEFADHVDVGDYNSARRFLVGFLYLNDVEEGGTTDFPKISYSVTPKCGRMLLFPPNWMYRHAGRPVTKGSKYILGTYLHYL